MKLLSEMLWWVSLSLHNTTDLDSMNYNAFSNEELLRKYQDGDFKAFSAFYENNHKIIFSFFLKRGVPLEQAEDLLQETFFRIHKYVMKYNQNHKVLSWVLTIAHNVYLNAAKNNKVKIESINEEQHQSSGGDQEYLILLKDVDNFLKTLDPIDQKIFKDRISGRLSYTKLSKELQIPSATARKRLSRLIQKFKIFSS